MESLELSVVTSFTSNIDNNSSSVSLAPIMSFAHNLTAA